MITTEFTNADDSPGLLLWRVSNAWSAAQRAALAPLGLTHPQFVLLASIAWLQGDAPVTQAAVAAHAGTDPMMTSQVVRALEAKNLVTRLPHPTDARAKSLGVTPTGAALANRAVVIVESVDREFFAGAGVHAEGFTRALAALDQGRARRGERAT